MYTIRSVPKTGRQMGADAYIACAKHMITNSPEFGMM